jgi:hypothetical protein
MRGRPAGAHRRGEEAPTEANGTSELGTASCVLRVFFIGTF